MVPCVGCRFVCVGLGLYLAVAAGCRPAGRSDAAIGGATSATSAAATDSHEPDEAVASDQTQSAPLGLAAATTVLDRNWQLRDVDGNVHQPFVADSGVRGVVVVFVMPDCPISNYFQPTLNDLWRRYAAQGVEFYLVHSDYDVTVDAVKQHASDYQIRCPVAIDRQQQLARKLDARVTPEAFLLSASGDLVYRGRINDLFTDYGKRRSQPTTNDLQVAMDELLAGKPITTPETTAIGCFITLAGP